MVTRILTATSIGILFIGLTAQPTRAAKAWANPSHRENLTFNRAVALPGVVLAAGTYTFEIPSEAAYNLVRVKSVDGRHIYFTKFTREVRRPSDRNVQHVTLGEAAPGMAPPINAWFPTGEQSGRQFIY